MTEEELFILKDSSAFGLSTFRRSLEGEEKGPHTKKLLPHEGYLPSNKAGYNLPEVTLQPR